MKRLTPFVIALALFVAGPVSAAQFYFGANAHEVAVGQAFEVGVFLNAEGESVNATEGSVSYDPAYLHADAVRDGGSAVTFWIERPNAPASCSGSCAIRFSGVVPGGTASPDAHLFTVVFTALKAGNATVSTTGERVLLNDGKGTPATVHRAPLTIAIKATATPVPLLEVPDAAPPEPFVPKVIRDPLVFDGRAAVVFGTQDKGSGIDHYEVAESLNPFASDASLTWRRAESPELLQDQSGRSTVFVKAFDRAGNARLEKVLGPAASPLYNPLIIWGILLMIGIIAAVFGRKLWRKRKQPRSR